VSKQGFQGIDKKVSYFSGIPKAEINVRKHYEEAN
jgi:hypothetical protein